MAVSPNTLKNNFDKELDHFEKLIDEQLKSKTLTGTDVIVYPPEGMNINHFEGIKERYLKPGIGWKSVTWHHEQRDGATMTFSIKTTSQYSNYMDR